MYRFPAVISYDFLLRLFLMSRKPTRPFGGFFIACSQPHPVPLAFYLNHQFAKSAPPFVP
jgi:hypothetical protein